MQAYGYTENKEAIINRLNRAEGQVRGITKMVNEDKYCIDILTQIGAAQAALDKIALELLRDHTKHCLSATFSQEELDKRAEELVGAVNRMLAR